MFVRFEASGRTVNDRCTRWTSRDDRRRDDDRLLVLRMDAGQVAGAGESKGWIEEGLLREGQSGFEAKFEGERVYRPRVSLGQTQASPSKAFPSILRGT